MANKIICCVHTTRVVIDRVHSLLTKEFPEYKVIHLLDETLLEDFARLGGIDVRVRRKLLSMVTSAEEAGASLILVTCSSLGNAVYEVQNFVGVPVLKVDEAMAEDAVSRCGSIGILATAKSAAGGTADLIRKVAEKQGRKIEVKSFICQDAAKHAALGQDEYDKYLAEEASKHGGDVEALLVSQVSMCGVEVCLPASSQGKILTSLSFAVKKMRKLLDGEK